MILFAAGTEKILCICLSLSYDPGWIRVLLCKALLYKRLPVLQTTSQVPEEPSGICDRLQLSKHKLQSSQMSLSCCLNLESAQVFSITPTQIMVIPKITGKPWLGSIFCLMFKPQWVPQSRSVACWVAQYNLPCDSTPARRGPAEVTAIALLPNVPDDGQGTPLLLLLMEDLFLFYSLPEKNSAYLSAQTHPFSPVTC